jgi:hypothetical protein
LPGRPPIRAARRSVPLSLALLLFAAGCEYCEEPLLPTKPRLLVTPEAVDVSGAGVSQDTPIILTLSNPSNVPLRMVDVRFKDPTDPAFRIISWPDNVLASETESVVIMVRPQLISTIEGTVVIEAEPDAQPSPIVEVPMRVQAVDLGLPDIVVDPTEIDFDRVGQGDVTRAEINVSNVGVRDLIIDETSFVPDVDGDESIRMQGVIGPGSPIAPNDTATVSLTFNPQDTLDHCGNLRILSNDPDESEVLVPVCGKGSVCPMAEIELLEDPTEIEPLDTIRFYGGDSFTDTQGVTVEEYDWRLTVRPPGSTAVLSDPAAPQTQLTVDIAGRYEVCLVVLDSDGVRSCEDACITVDVIANEELHVELVWDHPTADLDLHFLREGGTEFNHDGDCYFSNREPDWFEMNPESNPSLDADDNHGYGPENVNVEQPLPGSRWRTFIHYWNKQTDGDEFTVATLRVYAYGQLVGEFTQSFESDQTLWRAIEIVWSDVEPDPDTPGGIPPVINQIGQIEPFDRPF